MLTDRIEIIKGDITSCKVDAVVNAANTSLRGGGGVDGAIHRAAGPELLAECLTLGGCPTGEARITQGYNLPARYVIHTVGPVWSNGQQNDSLLLSSAYQSCLDIAGNYKLRSIAFPNISTGVYRFPKDKAAMIALSVVHDHLRAHVYPLQVIFVCFDDENYAIYQRWASML
jgi:O-acetyl-ADP-ribose deacetylase (regulator of RNase III)